MIKVLLEEDREGTLADMAHVFANFEMPGVELVPDYDGRVEVMRAAGIDRAVFLQKVYFPILKYLGITRQELLLAGRKSRDAHRDGTPVVLGPVNGAHSEAHVNGVQRRDAPAARTLAERESS